MTKQDSESRDARPGPDHSASRQLIGTAFELLGGMAHASAKAFEAAKVQISEQNSNFIEGMLKGNARFLEEMSHTMNSMVGRLRSRRPHDSTEGSGSEPQ